MKKGVRIWFLTSSWINRHVTISKDKTSIQLNNSMGSRGEIILIIKFRRLKVLSRWSKSGRNTPSRTVDSITRISSNPRRGSLRIFWMIKNVLIRWSKKNEKIKTFKNTKNIVLTQKFRSKKHISIWQHEKTIHSL